MPLTPRRLFYALAYTSLLLAAAAQAENTATLIANAGEALTKLRVHATGAGSLLEEAAGVLVFPRVVKVGFGGAAEYGEGCLMIDGNAVAFYSTAGARYGLPLGASDKSEVLLFMTPQALAGFRAEPAWKVGENDDVTVVRVAAGGEIDAATVGEPVLGFVFSDKGLVPGLTLEGAEFIRLAR